MGDDLDIALASMVIENSVEVCGKHEIIYLRPRRNLLYTNILDRSL